METDIVTNMPASSTTPSSSTSSSGSSIYSYVWKYVLIVLVLALLGFNLLTYFGQSYTYFGTLLDRLSAFFRSILAYFGYGVGEVAKKTINVTADTLTGGINVLEKGLKKPTAFKKEKKVNYKREYEKERKQAFKREQQPLPDEAGSLTQGKGTRKAGFCYIGEDRGFRACIGVGEGDECMSQDIYPTRDQCINPNLRSG